MGNKKVLFIGIGFYDYEDSIIKEFNKLDYQVDYFSEVPLSNWTYRFHSRMRNSSKINEINNYHAKQIANKSDANYDLIFIIKCENMSSDALKIIKAKNPKAKFVLYLWDSVIRIANIKSKFDFFDKIYSFDRIDCLNNKSFSFNPLFFREEYVQNLEKNKTYDLYHLGWYHSDRLSLLKKIAKFCNENGQKYKLKLLTGYFSYYMHKLTNKELGSSKEFLIFKTLSTKQNVDNILVSNIILDIAHPLQSGLTMRTIELLGSQKKLITTNADVINYDFYKPANIYIIDRENPQLDLNFFKQPYQYIPDEIRLKYSVNNWLKRMIN